MDYLEKKDSDLYFLLNVITLLSLCGTLIKHVILVFLFVSSVKAQEQQKGQVNFN